MATESTLEIARGLARLADTHKGEDIVILDVTGRHSLIDCFVVVSARNPKHAALIAEEAWTFVKEQGQGRDHREPADDWICCDFVDLVLHIFSASAREYYDFESLWADADRIDWEPAPDAVRA
jgi:ribosome-associated protein